MRLAPDAESPRSVTPCVVGLAARDDDRRNSVKPGVKRSASSTVVAAELRRSADDTTVVAAGVSTPRSSRRPAVTVTVSRERRRAEDHRDRSAGAERGGGDALGGEASGDDDDAFRRHRIGVQREGRRRASLRPTIGPSAEAAWMAAATGAPVGSVTRPATRTGAAAAISDRTRKAASSRRN